MSTSAISSANPPLQVLLKSKQDLLALQGDLSSGSLSAAQKDFGSFQQDALTLFQGPNAPTGTQTDLQALQDALGSGDLDGARNALAAFQNDLQNSALGHKHHHHHHHQTAVNAYQAQEQAAKV